MYVCMYVCMLDTCSLTLQYSLQFLRYDKNQRHSLPCMSYTYNFCSNI